VTDSESKKKIKVGNLIKGILKCVVINIENIIRGLECDKSRIPIPNEMMYDGNDSRR
jgi:hypothetical protein